MKNHNHTILGGGLSALIKDQTIKNAVILCDFEKKIIKSKKFYELNGFGGNTKIWGGYVNFERFKELEKNKIFKNFFHKTKLFKIKRISKNEKIVTFYLSGKNSKIFRIKKKNFKNPIIKERIKKIKIFKSYIELNGKNIYKTKKLSLCVGNLGLLKLLYNSKLINKNDMVSFYDGSCSYTLKFFLEKSKNYYIPMKISDIIKKLIFKKLQGYKIIEKDTLIYQKFSKKKKKYVFKVNEILQLDSSEIRFFLSNHLADLRINNIKLKYFFEEKTKRIKVYNSGILENYIPGPISQDLIYKALTN